MTTKTPHRLLPIIALCSLSACVNDAASLQIDGKEHSLSIVREQKWLWEKRVDLFIVVTRIPDCQRRHRLKGSSISAATFDVFTPDATTFYIQQAARTYSVETKTCEGFQDLGEKVPTSMGQKLGSFKEVDGIFRFIDEPGVAGQPADK